MPRRTLIPLIVACALFMENLDSTVLATALPAIAVSFGESPLRLNLAITSYLLSLAVFIPISGWVADRFGTRTVFRAAIVVFTLASILCGLSTSLAELVGARILQGLGGAMMVPVGRLAFLRAVPKSELVSAMAFLTTPALLAPVLGPPLGGFLTTYVSWRWIFWINVPVGILGIVLVSLYFENLRETERRPFDGRGFALTAIGLASLVFGLEAVGRDALPPGVVVALIAGGLVLLALFVRHARRVREPVVDLTLLRIPTFRAAVFGGFLFRIGSGAMPFLLPMLLQLGFGFTAFHSGLVTFVSAVGAMAMKVVARPILHRLTFRRVLIGNGLICAALIAVCGFFRPDTPLALILAVLLVSGLFRSLQFTTINALGYGDLPRERMSRATSFAGAGQHLSVTVGVAIGALLLNVVTASRPDATILASDFTASFLTVGAIAAGSILAYLPLARDVGDELAGRRADGGTPPS